MPRISSYTPAWLSRPSPGFDFFTKPSLSPNRSTNGTSSGTQKTDMSKTIARRGTQIFVVVDNELRWSDLTMLKEQWEIQRSPHRRRADSSTIDFNDEDSQEPSYRVLKVPVSRKIRQLIISPAEDYMAIITSHTAHIAVLPDASHLFSRDRSDLKLKAFQLGPTTHVMERSPIAAALWHPLSVQGSAFVTVTVDAVVRLWELDRKNRWSFDMAPLDFDLRKLADGQSAAEDFSPSKYGSNKGFSPDSFEMEVASASFGGMGLEGEAPWSAMTLWIAMKAGDIYALCPLLPSKWEAPLSLTASLFSSIQWRHASLQDKAHVSKYDRNVSDQQLSWITEVEKQQHLAEDTAIQRPSHPGSVPRLQGPFRLAPDPDQIFNITGIHVLSSNVDSKSETALDSPLDFLTASFDLVCLATSDAKIHICANLDTIEGSWLPTKKAFRLLEDQSTAEVHPELLIYESISFSSLSEPFGPAITPDTQSPNSIFISHDFGVSHIDLNHLASGLLEELNSNIESGVDFRVGMLVENSRFQVDRPIDIGKKVGQDEASTTQSTTCIDILDPELGHLLLTVIAGQVHAVTLDDASNDRLPDGNTSDYTAEAELQEIIAHEFRPAYQPPEEFWAPSTLSSFMEQHVHSRGRRVMSDQVLFSPTTLNLLMEAHRVLSHETHRLGVAAADLFSRCERLQDEFNDQVARAREAAERVDAVLGFDADPYTEESGNSLGLSPLEVSERLELVKAQHETLTGRYDELRRKLNSLNGRALNDKEKAWMGEVASMDELISPPPAASSSPVESLTSQQDALALTTMTTTPAARFEHVRRFKEQLLTYTREMEQAASAAAAAAASNVDQPLDSFNIAPDRRRARLAEVTGMLERQTALVEATKGKLERLGALAV